MLKSVIIVGGIVAVGIYLVYKKTGMFKNAATKIEDAAVWAKESFKEGYHAAAGSPAVN